MRPSSLLRWLRPGCLLLAAACASAGAHVHGEVEIDVAVDGNMLEIGLHAPLSDLAGFEHMPRTERQRRVLAGVIQRVRQPQALFMPAPAAQCRAAPVIVTAPVAGEEGHAALEATVRYECRQPTALAYVDVELMRAFPSVRRVKAEVVTPRGQLARTLDRNNRRLEW